MRSLQELSRAAAALAREVAEQHKVQPAEVQPFIESASDLLLRAKSRLSRANQMLKDKKGAA